MLLHAAPIGWRPSQETPFRAALVTGRPQPGDCSPCCLSLQLGTRHSNAVAEDDKAIGKGGMSRPSPRMYQRIRLFLHSRPKLASHDAHADMCCQKCTLMKDAAQSCLFERLCKERDSTSLEPLRSPSDLIWVPCGIQHSRAIKLR